MKFTELNLRPELLSGLEKAGFVDCTPIQAEVMPLLLAGKDVSGLAQTGTGKTAAYLLPMMEKILCAKSLADNPENPDPLISERAFKNWKKNNFVLVLVPTRELAEQVYSDVGRLKGDSSFGAVAVYGGTSYDPQKARIQEGAEFVIGTPGRLIDLYKNHVLDLRQVRAVVFDEADRMFDMGFKDDMKFILKRVPQDRQILMFSATINFDVLHTAYQFGSDPVECNISRDQAKAENVKDAIFHVGNTEKPKYLLTLLKKENPRQVIVFSNFKHNVDRISGFLTKNGYPSVAISSLLTQAQRTRVMEQFKGDNNRNIMVATDLAARGLDIKGVDLVVNYELPDDAENYVHRIGRTGRAGATGKAFSFVGDRDVEALMRIEDYLKHKVDVGWIEDTEFVNEFKEMSDEDGGPRVKYASKSEGGARPARGPRDRKGGPPRRDRKEGPRTDGPRPARPAQGDRPQGARPQIERGQDGTSKHRDRQIQSGAPTNAQAAGSQHRDRRTGRHQGPPKETQKTFNGTQRPQKSSQQLNNKGRRPDHRRPFKGRRDEAPKTLVGKVKSFLQKLFG